MPDFHEVEIFSQSKMLADKESISNILFLLCLPNIKDKIPVSELLLLTKEALLKKEVVALDLLLT